MRCEMLDGRAVTVRALKASALKASALAAPLTALVLAAAAFGESLALAARGVLPRGLASLLVPASFVGVSGAVWCALRALGLVRGERPLFCRHGFWLIALLAVLELPGLGSFGLIDPWESHYAEVAREMLARDDVVSTWWGHQAWFMSKPVLSFWLEASSMKALGVETAAGQVLGGSLGPLPQPEWAVRLPGALCALAGCALLYRGVAASAGRWTGWLCALVLATAAQWTLAARHALTDTPFVGALAACAGLWLLAANMPGQAEFVRRSVGVGRFDLRFDAGWLLIGCMSVAVGAQVAALLALNVDVSLCAWPPRLRFVSDTLLAGSPGNCGLPGQPACAAVPIAHPWLTPALQATLWSVALAWLVRSVAHERRVRQHLLLGAWFCMGIATLGKGLAGALLPLAVAGAGRVLERRSGPRGRAELVRGGVLLVLLVAPWYVALFARHGRLFFDELVLKHMFGRVFEHLHDTNQGDDVGLPYYIGQLGYGLFPWTALVPGALLSAGWRREPRSPALARLRALALIWLVLTFALFSIMRTKFHHYILPALPALAVLVGTHLGDRWRAAPDDRHRAAVARVFGVGGALLVARVGRDFTAAVEPHLPGAARLFHLLSYQYQRAWPAELDFRRPLLAATVAVVLLCGAVGVARWRRPAIAAQLAVSLAFAGWLGHVYLPALGASFGQRRVIEAFQRDRTSAAEPLIAYRLNWKGENFYTGNHLAIFVSSGRRFQAYLRARGSTDPVLHVVLEIGQLPTLRAELGAVRSLQVLTERGDSDKICLVRVELL